MNGREPEAVRLSIVPEGKTVKVRELLTTGSMRRRLLDMGLTPGTCVTIRKVAPMGDPIELHLRGYELTLRLEDAQKITLCGGDAQ